MEIEEKVPTHKKIPPLEALLYAATQPLSLDFIGQVLKGDLNEVETLVKDYENLLNSREGGLKVVHNKEGVSLVTRPEFAGVVKTLAEYKSIGLSRAALETLAIVFFRQPVHRNEIEKIRGTPSDQVIQNLEKKGLLESFLEENEGGRPQRLIRTTTRFLFYFGLTHDFEMEQYFKRFLEEKVESLEDKADKADKAD